MDIKIKWGLIILLIMGLSSIFTQCGKDYATPEPTYKFVEKLTLSPFKKIYSLNDTIWVQFQTADKSLYDQLGNSRFSTDTTFLSGRFYYYRRFPVENVQEFFCNIDIDNSLNPKFTTLYTWYNVLDFTTDCNSNRYFFRIGFIPKKTGIYSIEPNFEVQNCANKVNRNYTTTKFTFDLDDCNKDVWLSIPPISRGGQGSTDARIDKKEIFVFKVE